MKNSTAINLNEREFEGLRQLVFDHTGISLATSKKELVKRRFSPRLKALGLRDFSAYITHMKKNQESEISNFCNAITTNLTSFFRENHHYEYMKATALPLLIKRNSNSKKLRVWSAGCSTGQEAYCLAMTLKKTIPAGWNARILATDLDELCLKEAKNGLYSSDRFDKFPEHLMAEYFTQRESVQHGMPTTSYQASKYLQEMITFNKLNLMQSWPMKGLFDVIFCRNVFIYFEKETQLELVKRYAKLQESGSYLCIGHSETIVDPEKVGYRLIEKTLYMRE